MVARIPDRMKSHTMELPRLIVVGEKNMTDLGGFLKKLDGSGRVSLITGAHVMGVIQETVETSLTGSGIKFSWHLAGKNENGAIEAVQRQVGEDKGDAIVGIGGGRAVDVAKIVAFNLKKPFVSVPTAASHDGIFKPVCLYKGGQATLDRSLIPLWRLC